MKVCVVGSGGREHALAHVLARTAEVVVAPGNAGIPFSTTQPVNEIEADLFVIGPEQPLVEGLADQLRKRGKLVFGPNADGAKIEGSKSWMKEILVAVDKALIGKDLQKIEAESNQAAEYQARGKKLS